MTQFKKLNRSRLSLVSSRISLMACLALSAFVTTSLAQNKQLENSLLWEINRKDLPAPSYIFGTIHLICEQDFVLPEKVSKAFEQTDQLVLEIDMTDPEEMAYVQKAALSNKLISQKLSPERFAEADSILKIKAGLSLKQLDQFSLFTVYSLLLSKTLDCKVTKSYEMEFVEMARQKHLPVKGLEKVKLQMDIVDKVYTDSFIVQQFYLFDEYKAVTAEMVQIYKEENISKLFNQMKDERFNSPDVMKIMLEDRNRSWAKKIPELLHRGSNFFAVGAGHLAGKTGVIELLRAQGYTVTPVLE